MLKLFVCIYLEQCILFYKKCFKKLKIDLKSKSVTNKQKDKFHVTLIIRLMYTNYTLLCHRLGYSQCLMKLIQPLTPLSRNCVQIVQCLANYSYNVTFDGLAPPHHPRPPLYIRFMGHFPVKFDHTFYPV